MRNKGLEKYNDRLIKKIENRLISDFENSFWNKKRYEILNREIEKDVNDRLDIASIIDKIKDI